MLTKYLRAQSTRTTQSRRGERGSALIIALIFMTILTALAASLIAVTQIEVSSAGTYRQTVQARYVAESGAQSAVDWLKNNLPAPNPAALNLTQYPVALAGKSCTSTDVSGCVVLAAGMGVNTSLKQTTAHNGVAQYTDSTVATNFSNFFNSSSNGNSVSGVPGSSYNLDAQLMNVRVLKVLGGGTGMVQSWKITSQGNVNGVHPAQAQVRLIVESFPSPIFTYGAFGNSKACNAIDLTGLANTNSYDSSLGPWNSSTNSSLTQGNVGTNGSVTLSGANAVIHGNDAYANANGNCSAPSGPNAGTVSKIPPLNLPPVPTPPSLGAAQSCVGGCTSLTPGTHYGNISLSGKQTLTLGSGTYYLDGLSVSGQGQIVVSPPGSAVVIYIVGSNGPSISGNGISDVGSGDSPANFQILYGGTGSSSITGNGSTQVVLYAPNSDVSVTGNGGVMGAIYGNTVSFTGNGALHYDRQLANNLNLPGPLTTTAFSWDRY
jgi:Tfp pilus assembly protein PilX